MLVLSKDAFKEVSKSKRQVGGFWGAWLGVFQEPFGGNGNPVNLALSHFQAYGPRNLTLSSEASPLFIQQ